ncbi:O-antigen ligase family protein [Thermosediminibacter litoriperuensis]|uniref:O-antigen ligase n=1 Tax=Thermosediminibacter litoriperuensis TaxID=291989 RepID=A0A5S5AWS8_9FIRM|nr:O-antigen ligase family protein [Thermosediminibacter litoriperuensis]TYP57818.1 O-antigen ligase [Thermosediminibacter litoriperuensis]
MEAVNRWIAGSVVVKIIYCLFSLEFCESSLLYRVFKKISGFVAGAYKGCFFANLFRSEPWEKEAVARSRFFKMLLRPVILCTGLRDILNSAIENSFCYRFAGSAVIDFVGQPFRTSSLVFTPAILTYTALKVLFSGLSSEDLMISLSIMAVLVPGYFINLPLSAVVSGSGFIRTARWVAWNADIDVPEVDKRQPGTLYAVLGAVLGALYFALPNITFVKLTGLIGLGLLIYMKPSLGVYIVAFILPLVPTLYSIALIGLTFAAMLLRIDKGGFGIPTGAVPAALFLASAAMAAVFSVTRGESLKILPIYVAYFMAFLVFSYFCRDRRVLKTALLFQIASTVGISLYGIYQYYFVKKPTSIAWLDFRLFPEVSTRVYATLENPNVLAEYLVFVIPVVMAFMWAEARTIRKAVFGGLLGVIVLCLILTLSRGGWLGLALAVVIFAAVADRRLFIVLLVLALVSPLFLPQVIINRVASIGSLEDSSNAYRVTIWVASLRMLRDYWLTGLGLGLQAFSRVYRDYMIAGTPALHSHNFYLQLGIEMGVLGLVSFLWFTATVLNGAGRVFRGHRKAWAALLAAGIAGAVSGHLFHGLFDHVWFSPRIGLAFWEMTGILSALIATAGTEKAPFEGGGS